MLGPFYDVDIEVMWRIPHDKTAVGIDVDRIDVGTGQQTADDMMVERSAGKGAIVLARDSFAVLPHRN